MDGETFTPNNITYDFRTFSLNISGTENYTAVVAYSGHTQLIDNGGSYTINVFDWDKMIPTSDIIDALNSFGFGIEDVTPDEFRKIYERNMDENIQGIITADLTIDDFDMDEDGMSSYESDSGEIVNMDLTLEILATLGFSWPECDEGYLKRFIEYLNEVHYFD